MFDKVDLSLTLDEKTFSKNIKQLQVRLVDLQRRIRKAEIPVVMLFEGWDASGKGGSILRITGRMDPRGYNVCPIGAPNEIEKKHHYLWRFWQRLPERGRIVVFDRSWYGRVLVERVERFATTPEWKRAYPEIRSFEETLAADGYVLLKFWMHVSKDEQLRRFEEREGNPLKQWKITPEDWRNREKWDDYMEAALEMFEETNTPYSPWHVIPAECKRYARVETGKIVAETLEQALVGRLPIVEIHEAFQEPKKFKKAA